MSARKDLRVPTDQLRWVCDPDSLGFDRADEIPTARGIIGQDRALSAMQLAFSMRSRGHNVFVSGPAGTGRTTTVRHLLESTDTGRRAPMDIVYVNNFRDPDMPLSIVLPAGRGQAFRRDMEEFVLHMKRSIAQIFESDHYKERTKQVAERFKEMEKEAVRLFEEKIQQENFALVQIQMGPFSKPEIAPVINGEPVQLERVEALAMQEKFSKEEFAHLREKYSELRQMMEDTFKKVRDIKRKLREELAQLEKEFGRPIITDALNDLKGEYPDAKVAEYLDQVRDQVLGHMGQFLDKEKEDGEDPSPIPLQEDERYRVFLVNVVVDNTGVERPPVVVETSPNYRNLFGTIEKVVDRSGHWRSDFLHIKAGSVLRANGGFLVLNLIDLISEPGVWPALKRTLKNQQIDIQSYDPFYLFSTSAIKPEPIQVDVRVAMIGDPYTYQILYNYEPDFRKIFKVKADFDSVMTREPDNIRRYATFINSICQEEGLRCLDKTGVAAVVEQGVRSAGRQGKLSAVFSEVADILRESNYWGNQMGSGVLDRSVVERAIHEREHRLKLPEEKLQELFDEGILLIDIEGERVGQINGLSYYDLGDYQFGKPVRIIAQTSMGRAGIINIERESELSGRTFNKAMLIIDGFFRARFGQDFPLTLSASIGFEQSYGGIEGDSASVAELCTLISSLAEVPLRQDLAVTGSVNQYGDVQPIGGVNEKIEGFFGVCRSRRLTGTQGVVIPAQNLGDLMLRAEVVQASAEDRFHIYSVRRVEEAIELFTGLPAGVRGEDGNFPEGTVFAKVENRLRGFAERMRDFLKTGEDAEGPKDAGKRKAKAKARRAED